MKCVCGYEEKYIQVDPDDPDSIRLENEPFYRAGLTVTIDKQQGPWNCNRFVQKEVYVCPECGVLKIDIV